ncbi:hypothetical protein EW026_g5907 [Hermanssonia centrifuga]|uniref:AAA+ ATPase domain-containing protein n=1 Tax=Hermanssonia centrifuga TaxID=98765 RepID=A0A4S4KDM3_9APHY|nr:hypothetical protein EW026_g5907 [Hermanssonia centrifuga]
MADEKKPKRPRGRLSKAAVASSSKQRTLKDMFGGGASHTPPSMTTLQEAQPIIELLESSDTEMLPSTSEGAGLRRQDGVVYANGSPNVVALAPQAPPKKLYSMFERREESKSVQPDITSNTADEDVIHITNDASSGSCSPALAMPQAGSQPEGSSRDDPIVVVDTPARVRPLNPASQHRDPPAKAAWTIFSKKSVQQNLPSLKTTTALLPVLYPDAQNEEEITARSSDTDDFAFCQEMVNRRNPSRSATDEDRPSSPSLGTIPEDDLATLRSTYRPTRFGKQIGSTILLTGPSGAGKTASVYACAEELGWEVFEVYPGIGERSGGDLNRLIGDVGKNHLVKTEKGRGKASRRVVESDDESEEVDIESTVQFPPLLNEEDVQTTEPTVNQSVILIEEVDILYSSDTNFWPALISIIHECRRPVVLTCNDISLVPYKDLPLQATLQFQPCTTGLASSFLQALCLAEGVKVEREALERAYINSHLRDPPYLPDLRHTIIQLQFWLTGGKKSDVVTGGPNASSSSPTGPGLMLAVEDSSNAASTNVEKGIPGILRQLAKKSDFLSGLDSELSRDANGTLRDLSTYEFIPPSDEQLGYAVLPTDTDTDHIPVSTYYYQDENLMAAGLELSKRAHGDIRPDDMPNAQHDDRAVSLARLGPLLRRLRPWRESANDAALYLDYAPWIRYIVAADDVAEAGISEVGSQSRRSTKNSQKTSEVRWLKLEPEERDVLRNTALRIEDPSAGWKE